jgi:superfamily II DNA or RNA helicase
MKILISNNIEVFDPPAELVKHLRDKCSQVNPFYTSALRGGRTAYGIPRMLSVYKKNKNSIVVPRGCMEDLYPYLGKVEIEDRRVLWPPKPVPTEIKFEGPRAFQEPAVADLLQHDEGMLKAPAGSGKTVMALEIAARVGQPTLWITHLDRLYKQVIERVKKFIPDQAENIGLIRESHIEISDFLTVGMVDSMRNMDLEWLNQFFGCVMLDEAHHVPAVTFQSVIRHFAAHHIYGLTATDYRNDGLDPIMFAILGSVKSNVHYDDLVEAGAIMRPTVKIINTDYSLAIPIKVRNIYQYLLKYMVDDTKRNELISNVASREAKKGEVVLVVSNRRKHCRTLHKMISDSWEKTGLAIGDVKRKDVDAAIEAMETGDLTVLVCTYEMLGEGFDLDKMSRLLFATPFRARSRAEQGIGRIQRIAEGKKDAIVYEFYDWHIGYCESLLTSRTEVYQSLGVEIVNET